jgi:hypothetical protein
MRVLGITLALAILALGGVSGGLGGSLGERRLWAARRVRAV